MKTLPTYTFGRHQSCVFAGLLSLLGTTTGYPMAGLMPQGVAPPTIACASATNLLDHLTQSYHLFLSCRLSPKPSEASFSMCRQFQNLSLLKSRPMGRRINTYLCPRGTISDTIPCRWHAAGATKGLKTMTAWGGATTRTRPQEGVQPHESR